MPHVIVENGNVVWNRWKYAVDATLLAGGLLLIWVVADAAIRGSFDALHLAGAASAAVLLAAAAREDWERRHRWIVLVTLAETVGFLVPASAGIAGAGFVVLVAAGFVEGFVLGLGQGFFLPVRRLRFALLTGAGAATVWAVVLLAMREPMSAPLAAVVGLVAIGGAQWVELRHRVPHARRWIAWTALAWVLALPLSFAPSPFVDATTPVLVRLVLWGCAGMLMAYVMAAVTWLAARHIAQPVQPRRQ